MGQSQLLEGHVVLVTGAARGIGLAVAEALQAHGARVAMADVDRDLCFAQALAVPGAIALDLDVTSEASIAAACRVIEKEFGKLDGLVNNAAVLDASNAATVSLEQVNRVMAVNGTSVLRVTQAFLPLLGRSSHPSVVNTLSTQSFAAQPNAIAYGAAKGAALALTRGMAIDFAELAIRVNGVAPGFIDTRMAVMANGRHEHQQPLFSQFYAGARKIPLGRGGTPQDCVGAYVYLLSRLSSYVTGQIINVDGGLTATY